MLSYTLNYTPILWSVKVKDKHVQTFIWWLQESRKVMLMLFYVCLCLYNLNKLYAHVYMHNSYTCMRKHGNQLYGASKNNKSCVRTG